MARVLILIVQLGAVALLAFGLILSITPIPFGLPLVVVSLAILVMTTPSVAAFFRRLRRDHPEADERIRQVEERLPGPLREPLRRTDP